MSFAETLAFWAVAVSARIKGKALVPASQAILLMTPELFRSTGFDVTHDPQMGLGKRMLKSVGLTVETEDVGDFATRGW